MENADKKIGELLQDLSITQSAKTRIAQLIKEDRYLRNILLEYGTYPGNLQRTLNLQGYKEKTLKIKALEKITALIDTDKEYIWNFYRNAIIKYLIKEMPSLQNLLKSIRLPSKNYSTKELILEIKKHLTTYEVPESHLFKLYQYWVFETLADELEIFKLPPQTSPLVVENHKEERKGTFNEYNDIHLKKLIKDIDTKVSDMSEALKDEAKENYSKLNILLEQNKSNTNASFEAFQTKITKINHKETFYENEFQRLKNEIRDNARLFENQIESSAKLLKKQIDDVCTKKIQEVHLNLNNRLDEIISGINDGSKHINNSETKLHFVDDRKRTVAKHEENFVTAWSEYLSDECGLNFSPDEAMYAHTIYKSCNYLITDQYYILDSWLKFIGFHEFTNIESVEPLWISRMEWYGTLKHLETIDDKLRMAIFRNFNIAMTNSYLYPILDKWMAAGTNKNHKIFLIPSTSQEDIVHHKEIIQLAPTLQLSDIRMTTDGSWSKHHGINLNKNLPAINVSTFRSWIKESTPADNRNELIEIPSRQLGIALPETLLANYNAIVANLNKYFDQDESKRAAIEMSFMPYIVENYGKETFDNFVTLIKGYL